MNEKYILSTMHNIYYHNISLIKPVISQLLLITQKVCVLANFHSANMGESFEKILTYILGFYSSNRWMGTFIMGCCNSRPSGEYFYAIHRLLVSLNKSPLFCFQIAWKYSPDGILLQYPMINVSNQTDETR